MLEQKWIGPSTCHGEAQAGHLSSALAELLVEVQHTIQRMALSPLTAFHRVWMVGICPSLKTLRHVGHKDLFRKFLGPCMPITVVGMHTDCAQRIKIPRKSAFRRTI